MIQGFFIDMAKDPAFLFYPNDYIGGTMGMTFEEKGAYIELLMMQFNRGHMTSHMIGQTVGQLWVKLQDKFVQDENGLWYNVRLELEQKKRKEFTFSRKNNLEGKNQYSKKEKKEGHTDGHMTSHMENENRNENIDSISKKDIFKKSVLQYAEKNKIPDDVAAAFLEYWTAKDEDSGQMLYQVAISNGRGFPTEAKLKDWHKRHLKDQKNGTQTRTTSQAFRDHLKQPG